MQILHLDSSPRGERSHSRQLTHAFVEELEKSNADSYVVYRDLGRRPVPHIDEAWIAAAFSDPATHTPELRDAIRMSDELVDELLASDVIVIGAPMFNFSIPATLKAWIDQVVRVGRTFTKDYQGLVTGKKIFVLTARGAGGYGPGEAMEALNYHDTYLKVVLGKMGMNDVTFIHDEKTPTGETNIEASLSQVRAIAQEATAPVHLELLAA
jgi:FMN-dependent NADH-azoreductase